MIRFEKNNLLVAVENHRPDAWIPSVGWKRLDMKFSIDTPQVETHLTFSNWPALSTTINIIICNVHACNEFSINYIVH